MPARRKIPLIWKTAKESEQRLFKYSNVSRRVVQVGCDCPPIPLANVVGVGTGANTLLYSKNGGMTWTGLGNTIFTGGGNCALWNGSIWVAGGYGTNALAYSYDGINWVGVGEPATGLTSTFTECKSVSWNGSIWIGVAGDDQEHVSSVDGITWVGYSGINNGGAVILASNGSIILGIPATSFLNISYTSDAVTWNFVNTDINLNNEAITEYTDLIWDGSQFIITVGTRINPLNSKFYSPDGLNWSGIPNVGYTNGTNIGKTTNNFYLSRGILPDATEISSNGTVWNTVPNPAFPIVQGLHGLIFGTDINIIVCGYNNNTYIHTSDGLVWYLKNTGVSGNFKAGFFKRTPF